MPDQESATTKKCPYCAEIVQVDAKICKHCGKNLSTKKSGSCGMVLLLALVLFIWGAIAFVLSVRNQRPSDLPRTGSATESWMICERFVKDKLASPSTAEFPDRYAQDIESLPEETYKVTGYVDSQNGFGAMIRTDFICTVQYQPEKDNYLLVDLRFD